MISGGARRIVEIRGPSDSGIRNAASNNASYRARVGLAKQGASADPPSAAAAAGRFCSEFCGVLAPTTICFGGKRHEPARLRADTIGVRASNVPRSACGCTSADPLLSEQWLGVF